MKWLKSIPLELIFWITVLILPSTAKPIDQFHEPHFTFCLLSNLGVGWCPGCGLGRSIIQLFHGNLRASLQSHWLGIPAVLIISHRILTLAELITNKKPINKEKDYV